MTRKGRYFIARHGETVFNAAGRLQGTHLHTPLTRAGFAQADAMGAALRGHLGSRPELSLWASDTGRALQTLAVITEHLELDWHAARADARLAEIDMGAWGGRYYRELMVEVGPILDPEKRLFIQKAPGGEWYDDIAARLERWLDETADEEGDRLILMHGISSRVLRGLLTGAAADAHHRAPVAPGLPQGTMVMIAQGRETVIHPSGGQAPA